MDNNNIQYNADGTIVNGGIRQRMPLFNHRPLNAGDSIGATYTKQGEMISGKHKRQKMEKDNPNKWNRWNVRLRSTIYMILGFFICIALGPTALCTLVMCLQIVMYREIVEHYRERTIDLELPLFRTLAWVWYINGVHFTYGRIMKYYTHLFTAFIETPLGSNWLIYHTFISYMLFSLGLVLFVWSLKTKHLKYQFKVFGLCNLTVLLVVAQSTFLLANMFNGLMWFVMPCLLIISNDMQAYFWGFFFGKTQLIKLSPKKTWEGFIGALLGTVVFAFLVSGLLIQFNALVCKPTSFIGYYTTCEREELYIGVPHSTPFGDINIAPVQMHMVYLSLFASLVSPFGGFFASGLKRAWDVKDFGDTIPGHGGLTDRFDCQILMGSFVFIYYSNFVARVVPSVDVLYSYFVELSQDDQLALQTQINNLLSA